MIGIGLWLERATIISPVLSSTDSIHYQCLYGVQTRLQEISFPAAKDIDGGADIPLELTSITVKKIPLERVFKRSDDPLPLPCIIITPQRVAAPPTEGVTTKDDYVRPCLVTMVMADNEEPTLQVNLDVMSLWQEKVMHAFHNQRLPGVAEAILCHVEPAESVIPAAWGHQVLASAVLLKFKCRELRGLT